MGNEDENTEETVNVQEEPVLTAQNAPAVEEAPAAKATMTDADKANYAFGMVKFIASKIPGALEDLKICFPDAF
jgi:hypothetical protein